MQKTYDVIVIGGGAAGMFAAGTAAARGRGVLLIEGNKRLGEKLRITGGGRCNITNAEPNVRTLLSHYGESEKYLHSAFAQFGVNDTFSFFESRGLPLKIEARARAFPVSERAADVVRVLESYLKEGAVTIMTNARGTHIEATDGRIMGVQVGAETYSATSYILATGGVSHPETGSTGDGFSWLRALKHSIHESTPTIVPLKVKEGWVKRLAGVSMPDAKITFYSNGAKKFSRTGSILFTHFGISGPVILNAAGAVADLLHDGDVSARIDLFPGMDLGVLDAHITNVFDTNKNRLLRNTLKYLVPPGAVETFLSLIPEVSPETKIHSVRREERRVLAELLKALPLTIDGLMGFERAVVADGGLDIAEVDMRTMRSTRYQNLYVVGDLLHITRPSGGYSLQLCWTTGYIAGHNA